MPPRSGPNTPAGAMQYNDNSHLDTSEIQDTRSSGGSSGGGLGSSLPGGLGSMLPGGLGGLAAGGGGLGIVAIIVVLLLNVLGGGSGGSNVLGGLGSGQTADNASVQSDCKTGADANAKLDCAVVADIDSIQNFWASELPALGAAYTPVPTVWFSGQVNTGCGSASSAAGPFYCPADKRVYIDLTFYDDLKTQFGATGGLFVDAYVLAHEYGHHVQDLLGTEAKVKAGVTGPSSGSVRLELQADCYAGVWANHASTVPDSSGQPLISDITADDIANALDTASKIGDDYIQTTIEHQTFNPATETHGTSAQRQKWFTAGYQAGDPKSCDTFSATTL